MTDPAAAVTSGVVPGVVPGVVVVDKPAGSTSHDVVSRIRRLAGTRRVGHAGTLDPMATGVLVVGIGRATRLLGHLALTEKAYEATIRLGASTRTDDAEGEVTGCCDTSRLAQAEIVSRAAEFVGELDQVPSAVSAIKVDGQRSYARVRRGESVELAARPVHVSRFDVVAVRRGDAVVDVDVSVTCSSGTYIRALARDLGSRLGVGGHLTALRRTRVGPFGLPQARTLEQLATGLGIIGLDEVAQASFPAYTLDEEQAHAVGFGKVLRNTALGAVGPVAVFAPDGRFLALYGQVGPDARAVAVFVSAP